MTSSSQRRLGPKPIYVEDILIVILNDSEESTDPSLNLRMTYLLGPSRSLPQ